MQKDNTKYLLIGKTLDFLCTQNLKKKLFQKNDQLMVHRNVKKKKK